MAMTDSAPGRPPSPLRSLPTAECEVFGSEVLLDEETFSWYNPENWYSVRIGEVFRSRYQVLLKLGFGSVSTVWLCPYIVLTSSSNHQSRRGHRYVTLKVYETGHRQAMNETSVLKYLESIETSHEGAKLVRLMLDSFEVQGRKGPHVVIVHEPLSLSLGDIRGIAGGKLPGNVLKPMILGILLGLDFLHSVGHVVHTDIQEGNIMLAITDQTFFDEVVASEWASPSARKIDGDRVIYASTGLEIPDDPGFPIISDFGDAQFGEMPFIGEVMPDLYRAPEIILKVPWDEKIDIWALGLMVRKTCLASTCCRFCSPVADQVQKIWDLYEGKHLFHKRLPSREESSIAHMARMVSLLGAPPPGLLERSAVAAEIFDDSGMLRGNDGTPNSTLEDEEENLQGDEKAEFLSFLRKMLQWRPEDRASAADLMKDPWLRRM
ncbi:serine threonine [Cordyceps militaris]|uniref:non-specific serine/threonine protein kinase n=1 Tax=Cordyceps militaris TaxID=73501 RepID=A0A2H4S7D2_CORMI|nr:serine threonine [Cordyceps militaris]